MPTKNPNHPTKILDSSLALRITERMHAICNCLKRDLIVSDPIKIYNPYAQIMNVNLYTTIIIIAGLICSAFIGKLTHGGFIASLGLGIAAIILGIVLTFPLPEVINELCNFFGYIHNSCISVNEESFWIMFLPIFFSPLY